MAEITIPEPIPCIWLGEAPDTAWEVGWCFYWLDNGRINPKLTGRRPIWVVCPGWYKDEELIGTAFCVDSLSTRKNQPWDVTVNMASLVRGQKPELTVNPSIHLEGLWHGWLKNGILSQS